MPSIDDIQEKIKGLNRLLNPDRAPGSLSGKECNELGMLSLQVGAVGNDFNRTSRTKKDIKHAYSDLCEIEKKANKILKKGGLPWKFIGFIIVLGFLYAFFK